MATPALRIPRSISRSHRKPLHPKNFPASRAAAGAAIVPKKPDPTISQPIEECAGKENHVVSNSVEEIKILPVGASLGEELDAARQRTEQLRREKERATTEIREMDAAFERWIGDSERRSRELAAMDMEIRRIIRVKERRASCLRSSPFTSLRAKEEKRRSQTAQLQKTGNVAGKGKSVLSSGTIKSK